MSNARSIGNYNNDLPLHILWNKKLALQIKAKGIQLQNELKSLAKAHEIDVQSQKAKELQFRTTYEKYLTTGNFESTLLKKEGFKKFNKEMKLYNNEFKPNEYIPLHKLIYTNGEVDVEKVVCLHLLTVQKFDVDLFPKHNGLFPKRSRQNMLGTSTLHFYIIEIIQKLNFEPYLELKEGQDIVIMVNSNLEKLIISILEVLAIVSPQKQKTIYELSSNKKAIQEIMNKTKIHNFLAQVKECSALFSIRNYRLDIAQYQTEPSLVPNMLPVSRVRVKDRSGKLELIQKKIQMVITKYSEPQSNSNELWSMYHKKFCSCRKLYSNNSRTPGKGLSLLLDDGSEFALVTGSSCHLPTGSSGLCPSLTAIIKSTPTKKDNNLDACSSGYSMNQRSMPPLKNDQKKLTSSLLHKVKNTHRILIGKKAVELKSQNARSNVAKQKTPFNKIIENVFSKESLITFASTTENEELKLLFQPCCRGGLGLGTYILQPDNDNKTILGQTDDLCKQDGVVQEIKQENSLMDTAIIKQDIFTSETRTKMKQFLMSENPGQKYV